MKRQEDVDLAKLAFPALGTEAVVDALFGKKGIHVGDEGQMGGDTTIQLLEQLQHWLWLP